MSKIETETMDRPELIRLLRMAHDEIVALRRAKAELEPRARAYDNISRVIELIPQPAQGYGEDVAWCLKQQVEALVAEREAERLEEPSHD